MKQKNNQNQDLIMINKGAIRLNLVLIDNIEDGNENKKNALKYQCRTLEKYTNFNKIFYISNSIESSNGNYPVYKSYSDFYEDIVTGISPRVEYFVFIGLDFFFLRDVNVDHFIDDNMAAITYIKKQLTESRTLQKTIPTIYFDFKYNFNPVENYCCINNIMLDQYHKALYEVGDLESYLFKLLPVMNAVSHYGHNCVETKIQFANLSGGYHDKFTWVQTVHGSNRCPLGITFNKLNSETKGYVDFLDSIAPHMSRLESEITLNTSSLGNSHAL